MMSDYIALLIQVPLVGIFIWFTLKIVDRFMLSLDQRDKQWQEFLTGQRREFSEAISALATRLGEELKAMSAEIAHMDGVLSTHVTPGHTRDPNNRESR